MDFAVGLVLGLQVFVHVFRHQVAPVGGGVDQQVVAGRRNRTVQGRFQGLVTGFAFFEGQIVAEHDEALGAAVREFDDFTQIAQVGLVDFDQAQAPARMGVEQGTDQGAFACASGARHEHIVGWLAVEEGQRIAFEDGFLPVDVLQIVQMDGGDAAHGFEPAA